MAEIISKQEWECCVTDIDPEYFYAQMIDVTAGKDEPEEIGKFPLTLLSKEDLEAIKPGMIFTFRLNPEILWWSWKDTKEPIKLAPIQFE